MSVSTLQITEADAVIRYRTEIASAVRGLWNGSLTLGAFLETMQLIIGNGLTQAWNEGAAAVGIYPDEFTQDEINMRDDAILQQYQYISGLAQFVDQHSKANKGKLGDLQFKVNMWANRYRAISNEAKAAVGSNPKLKWVLGRTKEHCADCLAMAGRVYRQATWERYGIRPQSKDLACHGYNCQCNLEPTNEPTNKGRPPGLRG